MGFKNSLSEAENINMSIGAAAVWTPLTFKRTKRSDNSDVTEVGFSKFSPVSGIDATTIDVTDWRVLLLSNFYDDTSTGSNNSSSATLRIRFDNNPWVTHGGTTLDHINVTNDMTFNYGGIPLSLAIPDIGGSVYLHLISSWHNKTAVLSAVGLVAR